MLNFNPKIWEDALTEILSENYLLKNYGKLDPSIETDQKKYFAFKVDDIGKAQSNVDEMRKYIERCKVAIDLSIDGQYLTVVKHSDGFELPYFLKVEEVEVLQLHDSFDSAVRGIVRFGIKETPTND